MSRSYSDVLAVIVIIFTFSLFIRNGLMIRIWQVYLVAGGIVWIVDAIGLVQTIIALEAPWTRLAVILSLIALFTFFAAYWLENRKINDFYKREI